MQTARFRLRWRPALPTGGALPARLDLRRMTEVRVKAFLLDLLRSIGLYVLIVVGGSLCFLCVAPMFGYLPYSDRPGPGWYGKFPALSWAAFWDGVVSMFDWALLLVPYALVAGLIVFAVARLLERFKAPRVLVAVVGALLAGFVSGYIVLAIGWYIAIAEAPVYFAIVLGLVFGVFLLPSARRNSAESPGMA